ncbi:alanine aminotransferase 1 [Onthophagus taurus]|uniref:alanine aminotransferase 1 n=1 Tax=Onthophagus taurus TaxID=166361 RepID=UPI000C20C872|nr:alanine aminotransferase 1 [Onthophagus taurus]
MSSGRTLTPLIYRYYGLNVRHLSSSSSVLSASSSSFATAWDIKHRTADGCGSHKSFNNQTVRTMATNRTALTIDNMNPQIKVMEYAVRGPLVIRAAELEKELAKGAKRPFKEIIRANIGDCHAMGQKPITFIRQLLACVSLPELLDDPRFPADVKEKAKLILKGCKGQSVGSYTDSPGIEIIRRHVAEFIQRRDGIPSNWEDVILTAGASDAIKGILKLMIADVDGKKAGVMIPIPQYPLYTASLAEFDMVPVSYYLNEESGWSLEIDELERAVEEAKRDCLPRALVLINPGNPTGQVLTRQNIENIIKFAHKHNLFLLADEVYQDNVYDPNSKFHSFKKVLIEMGEPYSKMELASFMSVSKGYMGECGLRGGYTEVINMDADVKKMYLKALSAMLCPTVLGQTVIDSVVNHPREGDPSYATWIKEKNDVLDSLKLRAKMVADAFNSFEGFSCNPVQGAMYCFPQFTLPEKAKEDAERLGQAPDVFYAFQLLEKTGICIVPGSGFGQRQGTYHFRTTILPQPDVLKRMLGLFEKFHKEFMKRYQ